MKRIVLELFDNCQGLSITTANYYGTGTNMSIYGVGPEDGMIIRQEEIILEDGRTREYKMDKVKV